MQLKPLVSLLAAAFAAPAVLASTSGVVISQLYGANGNSFASDYVELHNTSAAPVSISGWSIQYASATGTGNFSGNGVVALSGSIPAGGFYLVRLATTTGTALPTPDATGSINMSGSAGKVVLANVATGLTCNGGNNICSAAQLAQIEDLVGYGSANFFEGAVAPTLTNTTALFRNGNGCTDTNNNAADFATGTPAPRNSASALVSCGGTPVNQPIVPSCPDQSAVSGTASSFSVSAADADSRVNAATVVGNLPSGVTLGNLVPAASDGAAATQSFDVSGAVAAGVYNLSLKWDNDEAQTASCNFKLSVTGLVSIPSIQGSGAKSLLDGSTVITTGIVTKLINNGFYMQDPDGDGDPATSDGIFVFTSSAPTVAVGDKVKVSAKVQEYSVSNSAASQANPLTELSSVTNVSVISTGNQLPLPVDVSLAALASQSDMERYEGMLVHITDELTVNQTNFVGSWGQLTVSAGGRTLNPTNVMRPGPAALAMQAANLARSVVLDDGSASKFPNPTPYLWQDGTVRGGDTLSGVTGVVDFGPSTDSTTGPLAYRIHPTAAPVFARPIARPLTPPAVGGNVRVASSNVLNFFTTFTDGTSVPGGGACPSAGCRGADNLNEFNRQRTKILNALSGLNADVVGLMEIQNSGNFAVQNLVDGLNAMMGVNTYAAVPLPAAGTGTDAIRVAMIYKPAKLSLMGASISDADPINNRPTYAQGFAAPNGEKFAVVVNHLKSKGSCGTGLNGDTGDLQGCWNLQRKQQAQRLLDWLPTVQATAGTDRVIMIGDFNSYAKEDPIDVLTNAGIIDLVSMFDPADYSYVFDASAGRLDHGLGTAAIAAKVTGATSWHINADEPEWTDYNTEDKAAGNDWYVANQFRASDHDPMLIGLNLVKNLTGTSGRDTIVGTAGDDIIEGGAGADTLTGNGGRNQFVYGSMLDAGDVITDFTVGMDTLVLTKLMASLGIASADPLASGHVTCTPSAAGAVINIDADGSAGAAKAKPLLQLKGVACSAINASSFKF
ncbi:putative extracellular nuclease [Pelomonas saccharophila]|uniref:Extracellular nuclease n=1 Tax=Roseateles saccharophilus TaxID=304 RepID=A0ABU1YJX4_ROSSA|nr:ExeM/NucH family extracellular endonuclease [Roseateles saccharophilus]MDR7269149.1 putative extracellular nuclease [Roseateles saccharophilus]